ncbi:protein HBT1 [Drosophila sechellia]|uniref:protein HBT1 n=1 Tax=Drosophila sechellia TaxID=7238 RepID=UPI0013DE1358|nr:protein HBT1 [Drosophila sechellia]
MDCKEAISKEQAVSRIAHNDFIIVSRQLLINRADTDKDKRSAKMLIIYSTGTQHIVTFKLPIHACTVQELFLKMNLHIEDNITIDCMENAGGIIHLVVSVGFAIGDTIADTIAKAEEYYKKVHQSRASAVAAPRNAVPVEEPPSRAVVKPSETSVANNGSQPAATKGKKHKKRHCAPGDTNADKVISSSNQDANTPKTKKHKKGHSAKDRNGYQAAGAQDKPGSSGNKQGNQTPTGNTSTSPKKSNTAQVISSADQDDNTPKTKKQKKRHSAEDSNGYQAAGAQDKPGSSGNKQGNQTPTGNTSTSPKKSNTAQVISSADQDDNTPKTKKQKKRHSAEDSNGYQAAGAQDKPGSSGNKQGNQTPTGNTSTSPKKSNTAQVISSADQDDNTPKTKKQKKRHSAEDSNGYQAAGAQDKPGSSGNKQGNQTPTGNTSTSPKKSNTAQVISSADQDDNTPKTKKQKKRHSAEDSNGYQAAGAQDKPGSSGNKQGNQTPTGNTSTSPKKSNTAQVISSADQDDNTPKTKKQKKRHSAEDSNGYQAAGAQDKPCSSGNKQGNQTPTGNTSNSPKKSNGLQGVQPAGDALASSQSIQSKDQVAHATVSKKSEETAGGSQSRVQPNVAYIPAPAEKATSDTIPTPAERAEKSRLRRNRNWILSRDFDEEVIVLLSSEDEETTAADNGQTEGRLSVDENPTLFTYPPTGTGGLSITIKDFMCLKEGSYLNDIIIDFYLRWLKNNIIPEGQRDGTHIFSTFFYKRLTTDTSPNKKKTPVAQRRHERVKKWTRNVNIFEKDFIIIPFNDQSHWILAIICFPYLTSSVVNDDVQTPGEDIPIKQPLILIFDSLADSKRNRDMAILRDYLNFEYKAKHPRQRARIFNRDNMPGLIVEVPQQENLTDCGLYLLQYAEQFFTKPIVNYKLPITELIDWFDLLTVTKKREDIANLIQNLMNEGNQQGITMPVIKFPTLNGIMVMDVDDEKECDTEEENQTINQYSFKTRAPPKRRHTLK